MIDKLIILMRKCTDNIIERGIEDALANHFLELVNLKFISF